jgi:hypothetical protein
MLCAALGFGCGNDNMTAPQSEALPVILRVPVRSVSFEQGDNIQDIRIIYWRSGTDRILSNTLYAATDFTLDTGGSAERYGTLELSIQPGLYDFMAVANEKTLSAALAAATTVSELNAIKVSQVEPEGGAAIDGYPPGVIVEDRTLMPFTRVSLLRGVRIGNVVDDSSGQISLDGGMTWGSELPFRLIRYSARINLYIRKMTGVGAAAGISNVNDRFFITALRLLHLPNNATLIPSAYTENAYNSMRWYEWDESEPREANDYFTLNNNGGVEDPDGTSGVATYTYMVGEDKQIYVRSNRLDIMIPEYLPTDPYDAQSSMTLEIRGDYEPWDEESGSYPMVMENVWAIVPLPTGGDTDAPTYEINRNKDYHVMLTVGTARNYTFNPDVTIVVSDWDMDTEGYFNGGNANLSLSGSWSNATPDSEGKITLAEGAYAQYSFAFARGTGDNSIIRWRASLTNPVDFKLTSDGGSVAEGYARAGDVCKVSVSPKVASDLQPHTKLYINVDDGAGGTISLPLNAADTYTIHQE